MTLFPVGRVVQSGVTMTLFPAGRVVQSGVTMTLTRRSCAPIKGNYI